MNDLNEKLDGNIVNEENNPNKDNVWYFDYYFIVNNSKF